MKWNYTCHRNLMKAIHPLVYVQEFLTILSWEYAHYRNGGFKTRNPEVWDKHHKNVSLWSNIKKSWHTAGQELNE